MSKTFSEAGFNSLDCYDITLEGIGDTTIRPTPPELRKLLEAETEKDKNRVESNLQSLQAKPDKDKVKETGEVQNQKKKKPSAPEFNSEDCIDIVFLDEDDGPAGAIV